MNLEITVTDDSDIERTIIVTKCSYRAGRAAWSSPGEYMDNPPESPELEDVEVEWADRKGPFTEIDWAHYGTRIEDELFEYFESQGPDDYEDVDRDQT